jgi:hypothetical protein
MTPEQLGVELHSACAGLAFPSEETAPLVAFVWPDACGALSSAALRAHLGLPPNTPTEELPLSAFLRAVPEEDQPAFAHLRAVLETHLRQLHVVKLGRVNISAYLIGETTTGCWAGVQVALVET